MPEKNSRLITDLEKDVFLGVLIKYLVDEKMYEVETAWKAVCVNSKVLGHTRDWTEVKFEHTGSIPIGEWYDLSNTLKLVKRHETFDFMVYGYRPKPYEAYALADSKEVNMYNDYVNCVGEIVLDV